MHFRAPLAEQAFVLRETADLVQLSTLAGFGAATPDMADAILAEAGVLASDVFAPLNQSGDREGARLDGGRVAMPEGFGPAYQRYVEGGWGSLAADPAYGGQGLPFVLACAVQEQFTAANMALSLCMMLGQGAIAAFAAYGTAEQKQTYLAKLVSGEWTGTMNLTEPQAGSDVGALKTRAVLAGDGSYRIKGGKIFITFGEHDLAPNIVHLVLARLPGAPLGTKGISLFLVPKILADGTRNDVRCVSIERKLGIHASPTCTMSFGDDDGCVGYLVGAENGGMRAMFTMMNHARINVALQGVAIAERATQAAAAFARERVQGRRIIEFADVRRMLMTMRATTQAIRALVYFTAAAVDRGLAGDKDAQGRADLLTPVAKAYATDMGVEVASLGVQIFGGMGYVEDTGIAQLYRDARIAPIYEGTNGIQALDLVGRKLPQGHWAQLFAEMRGSIANTPGPLVDGLDALDRATNWLRDHPGDAAAGATPYLRMFGVIFSAYLLARQANVAKLRMITRDGNPGFLEAKIATANFFMRQLVPQATALLAAVTAGSADLFAINEEQLALE